ncbi:hypothetical protein HYV86_07250 [Candidatus Woesearchaeota archaeon]|nr:hypothetical protein [Candidatus Woesearchaeota archaeon]
MISYNKQLEVRQTLTNLIQNGAIPATARVLDIQGASRCYREVGQSPYWHEPVPVSQALELMERIVRADPTLRSTGPVFESRGGRDRDLYVSACFIARPREVALAKLEPAKKTNAVLEVQFKDGRQDGRFQDAQSYISFGPSSGITNINDLQINGGFRIAGRYVADDGVKILGQVYDSAAQMAANLPNNGGNYVSFSSFQPDVAARTRQGLFGDLSADRCLLVISGRSASLYTSAKISRDFPEI